MDATTISVAGLAVVNGGLAEHAMLWTRPIVVTCVADVDDGSGTGTRDGGVTIEDLVYFLDRFAGGC